VGVLILEGFAAETGTLTNTELAAIAKKATTAIDNLNPILGELLIFILATLLFGGTPPIC
jgi:hypothetical protein